jgi:hypothetical protein
MAKHEDKIQTTTHDQGGLLGETPSNILGPDRTASVVKKLKEKHVLKAKDANVKMDKANISKATDALSHFVNRH